MLSCNLVFLSVKEPLGKHKAVTVLGKQGWNQARSQDFLWGRGGGCVSQKPGPNNERFERYTMLVPKTHCVDCPSHGLLNSNYSERSFMIRENLTSAQGARR